MSLTPGVFRVLWGKDDPVEITGAGGIASLTFSDSMDEDSTAEIVFAVSPVGAADLPETAVGQPLLVQFGRGELCDPILMVIEEAAMDYGNGVSLRIRAHDKGSNMKGVKRGVVWPAKTQAGAVIPLDVVVTSVARTYDLTADVNTDIVEFDRAQARETDFRYLERLAIKHGYRFWIDGDFLRFRKDTDKPAPVLRAVFGNGDILKSFKPRTSWQEVKAAQDNVVAQGYDRENRKAITEAAGPANDDRVKPSGQYYEYDAETGIGRIVEEKGRAGDRVLTPAQTQPAVASAAQGARQKKLRLQQEATAELPGFHFIRAGTFVEIDGVADVYKGLWRVRKSTHTLGSKGYSLSLILERETVGEADGQKQVPIAPQKVNKSTAPAEREASVVVDAESGTIR